MKNRDYPEWNENQQKDLYGNHQSGKIITRTEAAAEKGKTPQFNTKFQRKKNPRKKFAQKALKQITRKENFSKNFPNFDPFIE